MLAKSLQTAIEATISAGTGHVAKIFEVGTVSGGSINRAFKLQTNIGQFFVKLNAAAEFPKMMELEAAGLKLLAPASALRTPNIIGHGTEGDNAFLVLEFLTSGAMQPNFWEQFGEQLAALHRNTAEQFGLDHDNYIGSLPQSNRQQANWIDFFVQERLEAQCRLARNTHEIDGPTLAMMERLYHRLDTLIPKEPPALLHGDLWSGNYHVGPNGEPCIIDPAVYFGHREMDLGMSKLFGGFAPAFYESYNNAWPLQQGWEERLDLCNLYPLLVHVNLFGGGYLAQVRSILKRFV